MPLTLLGESNVTTIVITPFLQLELLPDGAPNWGAVTNNNWIKVENKTEEQQALIDALDTRLTTSIASLEEDIGILTSEVENEAIARSQGDQDLQDQIDVIQTVGATVFRQTGIALTGGVPLNIVHNLGSSPLVDLFRESDGVVVSNLDDTIIKHIDVNTVSVEVGATEVYTLVAVG